MKMGITIHWDGSVKDKDTTLKIISYARLFAESLKWENTLINEKGIVMDTIIKTNKENYTFKTYIEKEQSLKMNIDPKYKYNTYRYGVMINPSEPINIETIHIVFYEYYGEYIFKDFCKTQVFSEKETSNLIAHQLLISMLETIKSTWMPNLNILDESDYYVPTEPNELEKWLNDFYPEYRDAKKKLKPYNFEVMLESHTELKNMINNLNMSKALTDLLDNKRDDDK